MKLSMTKRGVLLKQKTQSLNKNILWMVDKNLYCSSSESVWLITKRWSQCYYTWDVFHIQMQPSNHTCTVPALSEHITRAKLHRLAWCLPGTLSNIVRQGSIIKTARWQEASERAFRASRWNSHWLYRVNILHCWGKKIKYKLIDL